MTGGSPSSIVSKHTGEGLSKHNPAPYKSDNWLSAGSCTVQPIPCDVAQVITPVLVPTQNLQFCPVPCCNYTLLQLYPAATVLCSYAHPHPSPPGPLSTHSPTNRSTFHLHLSPTPPSHPHPHPFPAPLYPPSTEVVHSQCQTRLETICVCWRACMCV